MQFEIDQASEILAQTPDTLRAMLGNLSEDWTHGGSREDWSPYDIVGHLIHAELTDWIPRAQVIVAGGDIREFGAFDRFAQFENSKDKTLSELLDGFNFHRGESLNTLKVLDLTPEKLALKGIHPELGEVTLAELIATWVVHDMTHIRQIVTFMAKRYDTAVGPWKEYLSILK
jgi:hypothetical protein